MGVIILTIGCVYMLHHFKAPIMRWGNRLYGKSGIKVIEAESSAAVVNVQPHVKEKIGVSSPACIKEKLEVNPPAANLNVQPHVEEKIGANDPVFIKEMHYLETEKKYSWLSKPQAARLNQLKFMANASETASLSKEHKEICHSCLSLDLIREKLELKKQEKLDASQEARLDQLDRTLSGKQSMYLDRRHFRHEKTCEKTDMGAFEKLEAFHLTVGAEGRYKLMEEGLQAEDHKPCEDDDTKICLACTTLHDVYERLHLQKKDNQYNITEDDDYPGLNDRQSAKLRRLMYSGMPGFELDQIHFSHDPKICERGQVSAREQIEKFGLAVDKNGEFMLPEEKERSSNVVYFRD